MYPIQFVVYKHTAYAPQAKQGFSWSTFSNLFYNFIGELHMWLSHKYSMEVLL